MFKRCTFGSYALSWFLEHLEDAMKIWTYKHLKSYAQKALGLRLRSKTFMGSMLFLPRKNLLFISGKAVFTNYGEKVSASGTSHVVKIRP